MVKISLAAGLKTSFRKAGGARWVQVAWGEDKLHVSGERWQV